MATNKQHCANPKCKKPLVNFRMVLMMGPRGYRRYAVCHPCAEKIENAQKAKSTMQKVGA